MTSYRSTANAHSGEVPLFQFRILSEDDLLLLTEWLNRPHLQRWWRQETATLDVVRSTYLPRLEAASDEAIPHIATLAEAPVGFLQYYSASDGDPDWWPDVPGAGVLGIDAFLANSEQLGHGLGTAMISQFVARLFENPDVREIRVDPLLENRRAIRCYEKVGFVSRGQIATPHGPAVYMSYRRPAQE